jgi:hypothetical protein
MLALLALDEEPLLLLPELGRLLAKRALKFFGLFFSHFIQKKK